MGATIEAACWAVGVLDPSCEDPDECPDEWRCPEELAPDWPLHGNRMFADGTHALAQLGLEDAELPGYLRRFCLYRATDPDATLVETSIPASLDCPAATPQGNALTSSLQQPLRDVFDRHTGAVPDVLAGEDEVEVAIVDTHSDRSPGSPSVDHAVAVERVIEALACPDPGACAVQRSHALALPLRADGSVADPEDGVYGTRAHLALGVMEAVTAWRRRLEEDPTTRRLVINLSLGWTASTGPHCAYAEDTPWCENHVVELAQRLDTPVWNPPLPSLYAIEALHAALVYASCNGAFVVAAAGNARDDSCNLEQLAPAVWGKYRAPTGDECIELGFDPPEGVLERLPPDRGASWPLVMPVAAVRPDDSPIAATRPGSLTPLVAAGYHATADLAQTPLTGTSMSAAVVSGIAALAWSQDPALLPGEILEQLHATGAPLGFASELPVHGWPAGTDVRRVSACAAQPFGSTCDPSDRSELDDAIVGLDELAIDAATNTATSTYDANGMGFVVDDCSRCGARVIASIPSEIPASTDHWFFEACVSTPTSFVFDGGSELAGPQPDVPICPDCPLVLSKSDGQARAYLAIDERYADPAITWHGANLVMVESGSTRTVIDLAAIVPLEDLQTGDTIEVILEGSWPHLTGATMNAVLEIGGESTVRSNELLLVRE